MYLCLACLITFFCSFVLFTFRCFMVNRNEYIIMSFVTMMNKDKFTYCDNNVVTLSDIMCMCVFL